MYEPSEWETKGTTGEELADQDLKSVLEGLAKHLFGEVEVSTAFRPSTTLIDRSCLAGLQRCMTSKADRHFVWLGIAAGLNNTMFQPDDLCPFWWYSNIIEVRLILGINPMASRASSAMLLHSCCGSLHYYADTFGNGAKVVKSKVDYRHTPARGFSLQLVWLVVSMG